MSVANLSTKSQTSCNTCGKSDPLGKCGDCEVTRYCDKTCMEKDMKIHKKICRNFREMAEVRKMCAEGEVERKTILGQIDQYHSLCQRRNLDGAEDLGDDLLKKMDVFLKTGGKVINLLAKILKWLKLNKMDSGPTTILYGAEDAYLKRIRKLRDDIFSSQEKLKEEIYVNNNGPVLEILVPHFPNPIDTRYPDFKIMLILSDYL